MNGQHIGGLDDLLETVEEEKSDEGEQSGRDEQNDDEE